MKDAVCTVVISLKSLGDWYPTCGQPAVALGAFGLPVCQEHAELFEIRVPE